MKYEIVEVDPEFDQSDYLYVLMIQNPSGYVGVDADSWEIVLCCFRQSEVDKRVDEISNHEKWGGNGKRNLRSEEVGVMKIKLPPNVKKSWIQPGQSLTIGN